MIFSGKLVPNWAVVGELETIKGRLVDPRYLTDASIRIINQTLICQDSQAEHEHEV